MDEKLFWLSLAVNVLLGVGGWVIQQYISQLKESQRLLASSITDMKSELTQVKLDYLHKADFREFKSELWERFDRLEKFLKKE